MSDDFIKMNLSVEPVPIDPADTVEVTSKDRVLSITERSLAATFEEWMRRFTDDPAKFQREFEAVNEFDASPRSYGETQATYFLSIVADLEREAAEDGLDRL